MGSSREIQFLKERGIEGDISNKVTIAESSVKLESEKDKESRERELYRTTTRTPDVRNRIAKADKLFKQEVIPASLGRIM